MRLSQQSSHNPCVTDRTPPTGTPAINPPRPLPTLATVQASVDALLREMRGARLDIDGLKTEVKTVRAKVSDTEEIIRISHLPSPASLVPSSLIPPPASRPSIAAKAAQKGLDLGKYTAIVIGVLSVVAQVVAQFKPAYLGPITSMLKLLGGGDQ